MSTINKKKVAIIGTVGLPASYGGFETLAEHLVKNLDHCYDLTVYCSKKRYPKAERKAHFGKAKLVYLGLDANGIQSIPYDSLSILHALFFADVLLILGVAGAWILPFVRLFTNKKIIISIDGIEWKRNKWSLPARWYLWWAEKIAVKYSHVDISDNESIQDYTAIRYGSLSRIIEYGANHTLAAKPTPADKEQYPFLKLPYAIKVCRIEPENNVHEVLEAFSQLPKHTLVLIGNWKNSAYGMALREKYGAYPNLILLDPIYNQKVLDVIRGNALLYVHGHSAGGTNPSLVEAMYLGLPVFSFGVSYNRTTTEGKAIYFQHAADLKHLIETTSVSSLKEIAVRMKEIANRRYTWEVIASKYQHLIEEAVMVPEKISVAPVLNTLSYEDANRFSLAHLQFQKLFFEKA